MQKFTRAISVNSKCQKQKRKKGKKKMNKNISNKTINELKTKFNIVLETRVFCYNNNKQQQTRNMKPFKVAATGI